MGATGPGKPALRPHTPEVFLNWRFTARAPRFIVCERAIAFVGRDEGGSVEATRLAVR